MAGIAVPIPRARSYSYLRYTCFRRVRIVVHFSPVHHYEYLQDEWNLSTKEKSRMSTK